MRTCLEEDDQGDGGYLDGNDEGDNMKVRAIRGIPVMMVPLEQVDNKGERKIFAFTTK